MPQEEWELDEEIRNCNTCRFEGCNKEEEPCKDCLDDKENGYESCY